MLKLSSTHDFSANYPDDITVGVEDDVEKDFNYNADCNWIEEIIRKVPIVKSEEYHGNLYFMSHDRKLYVTVFSSITLWSNIMNSTFESSTEVATSSDIESFFKSLKHGILQMKMNRVDDFLDIYIDFVNAKIKLNAISRNDTTSDTIKPSKRSKSLEDIFTTSQSPGFYFFYSKRACGLF